MSRSESNAEPWLPERQPELISLAVAKRSWRRRQGYGQRRRHASDHWSAPDLAVVEYQLEVSWDSPVAARTLLFFSDLHWPPPIPGIAQLCRDAWAKIRPDWVVFGGDLATDACHLPEAFSFLQQLPPPTFTPAVAVLGNWDRRRRWLPHARFRADLATAGFNLLVDESRAVGPITFHGLDEPLIGHPQPQRLQGSPPPAVNCLLCHCVDPALAAATITPAPPWRLLLCGHSHAGQIRLPGHGAILASSRISRAFDYGQFQRQCPAPPPCDLIVTGGIGCSRIPLRLFCQPEIVVIRFVGTAAPSVG